MNIKSVKAKWVRFQLNSKTTLFWFKEDGVVTDFLWRHFLNNSKTVSGFTF